MDALLDLLFELLGWVFPLLAKFWFLILAFIGYKFFGKSAKKMAQGKPRRMLTPGRMLTPVENGGYPPSTPQEERKVVRASSKYEPMESDSMEGVGVEQEWAWEEPDHHSMPVREHRQVPPAAVQERAEAPADHLDPREGMKWAIIFGEPRAKVPHGSPAGHRRNA